MVANPPGQSVFGTVMYRLAIRMDEQLVDQVDRLVPAPFANRTDVLRAAINYLFDQEIELARASYRAGEGKRDPDERFRELVADAQRRRAQEMVVPARPTDEERARSREEFARRFFR
jgi:Arc/MetJ-type ribon-helix-helix transcriptional regulator